MKTYIDFLPVQLPDGVKQVGCKKIGPFEFSPIYHSATHNFTGTEQDFIDAGLAYRYREIDRFTIIAY